MNNLYYGDNLEISRKFIRDESVDLCYIDPPFNSKRNYNQIYNNVGKEDRAQAQAFIDTWEWNDHAIECFDDIMSDKNHVQTSQSIVLIESLERILGKGSLLAYLASMTVRIAEIHRTLKKSGSFYLHCDDVADSYLRLICDAIFVPQGGEFKNEIIWKRTTAHSDSNCYGRNADRILFYTKSSHFTFNTQYQPYSEEYKQRFRSSDTDGRRWADYDLTAKGLSGGGYEYEYRGTKSLWRCPPETMERLDRENKLHFTKTGGIRMKRYLDELPGIPAQSIWDDIFALNSQAAERLGYPTQKPEALLERIINASSNEGDVVLDTFCGCGTTVAAAQRLKRRWIGIDITYQSISLIMKRLKKIENATEFVELHGIPRDLQSVQALIHKKDDRVRKEFEKWAVLTFSDNLAFINEKKGADKGVDGVAYTFTGHDDKGNLKTMPVIFSVKSGHVNSSVVRDLHGTVEREKAAAGILITMEEPSKPMLQEAKQAGQFKGDFASFDRLQIVTVKEILSNKRINLPMYADMLKKARSDSGAIQPTLY